MATEKMSKGFLTKPKMAKYPNTHNAFAQFVKTSKNYFSLRQSCGFDHNYSGFDNYLKALAHTALAIENLSPEGDSHPNPEYPWEVDNKIITPLEHDFSELKLSLPKMSRMIDFLKKCFELIDRES